MLLAYTRPTDAPKMYHTMNTLARDFYCIQHRLHGRDTSSGVCEYLEYRVGDFRDSLFAHAPLLLRDGLLPRILLVRHLHGLNQHFASGNRFQ